MKFNLFGEPTVKMHPLLIRLSSKDILDLERLAEIQGSKKTILVRTAVREFLGRNHI